MSLHWYFFLQITADTSDNTGKLIAILLAVISFFAVRSFQVFDEVRKDVKQLLLDDVQIKAELKNQKDTIVQIKNRLDA